MRPRVHTLTPATWSSALARRRFTLVRVAHGPRGFPAALAEGLSDLRPEGVSFGLVDAARRHPPRFWLEAFQSVSGPLRRDGSRAPDGFYLFRDGLIVAHHGGGVHADPLDMLRYFRPYLVDTPIDDDPGGWVHEQRAEPGAGWRGGSSGSRQGRPPPPSPPPAPAGPDPYEVLGVASTASDDELRQAYKAALKANHPDRVAHLSPALQQFALAQTQAIRQAWETLRAKRGL